MRAWQLRFHRHLLAALLFDCGLASAGLAAAPSQALSVSAALCLGLISACLAVGLGCLLPFARSRIMGAFVVSTGFLGSDACAISVGQWLCLLRCNGDRFHFARTTGNVDV